MQTENENNLSCVSSENHDTFQVSSVNVKLADIKYKLVIRRESFKDFDCVYSENSLRRNNEVSSKSVACLLEFMRILSGS